MRDADGEKAWERRLTGASMCLEALTSGWGCKSLKNGKVSKITILLPSPERGECLLVVKAHSDDGDFVGFVGGLDVVTAMLMWKAKEGGQGLKYREDTPWQG